MVRNRLDASLSLVPEIQLRSAYGAFLDKVKYLLLMKVHMFAFFESLMKVDRRLISRVQRQDIEMDSLIFQLECSSLTEL
jgi:hypothetical protein